MIQLGLAVSVVLHILSYDRGSLGFVLIELHTSMLL